MRLSAFLVALISVFGAIQADEKVRYDNFEVHRVTPLNKESVEWLHNMEESPFGFDFWTSVKNVNVPVDVMVPPHLKMRFSDFIKAGNFSSELYIPNVQTLIDQEEKHSTNKVSGRAFGWTQYYSLDEINAWLRELANSDSRIQLVSAGRSYQNREIIGLKISFAPGNQNRSVFIEGNIHAREWISSAVVTYVINQLLSSTDPVVRRLAESRDWYIFPVVNPDGFVYSKTSDRMWRKTRTPYAGGCYGADPNRNWDYHFNEGGTSDLPCSETYRGPSAFSEPSTRSLSNYIRTIGPNLQAYISFHSYSQLLLIPYGYSNAKLDNYNDLFSVGQKAVASLRQKYGTTFRAGNIVDILYVASGGSMDWAKGIFKTPITYTYELRDTGNYGFVLPANQISPSGAEILDSLVTIFQEFDQILKS